MPPLLPSLLLAAIAATLSPTPLRADAPSSDGAAEVDADAAQQRAGGIIARTASPFCPGKTLEACPSPGAAEWRADIRRWTAAGVETSEIRERLQARVPGFDLRQSPPGTWPLFLAVAFLSVVAVGLGIRRLVRRAPRAGGPGPSGDGVDDAPEAPRDVTPDGDGGRDEWDDRLDDALRGM